MAKKTELELVIKGDDQASASLKDVAAEIKKLGRETLDLARNGLAQAKIKSGELAFALKKVANVKTSLGALKNNLKDVESSASSAAIVGIQRMKNGLRDVVNYRPNLRLIGTRIQDIGVKATVAAGKMGVGALEAGFRNLKNIAAGAITGAGIAAVAFAGTGMNLAMQYEAQLSSIRSVSGLSQTEMKKVSDLAMEQGAKTKYSALEAAQGIEELIKAGLSTKQVLEGGLAGALNLAAAGGLELADAAEIASTALNAFKKDNLTVAKAADILAGAANASATDVGELKFGLSQISAVAAGVGLSFKDTATGLAVFAQNGLKGSDAGTSLKTMLLNLQPQTKKQMQLFEDLGLATVKWERGAKGAKKEGAVLSNAFFDQKGKIKDLASIAGTLKKAMKGMTDQQRLAALETLFGSDAIRAGNILFKEGEEGVKGMSKAMLEFTAADVAKEKTNNLAGSLERLKGSIETKQIELFKESLPGLTGVVDGLGSAVDRIDIKAINNELVWFGEQWKTFDKEVYTPIVKPRLDEIAKWLNAEGKPAFKDFIKTGIKEFGEKSKWFVEQVYDPILKPAFADLKKAAENAKPVLNDLKPALEVLGGATVQSAASTIGLVADKIEQVTRAAREFRDGNYGDAIANMGRTAINIPTFGQGGKLIDRIQGRAMGGIVNEPVTLVGERGPELVSLPNGSRVHRANETKQMLNNNTSNSTVINIDARGAILPDDKSLMEFFKKNLDLMGRAGVTIKR